MIIYEHTVYANVLLVYQLLRSLYHRRLPSGVTQKGKKRRYLYPMPSGEGTTSMVEMTYVQKMAQAAARI